MTELREPSAPLYGAAFGVVALASLLTIWLPAFPVGVDMPTHLLFASVIADPERYVLLMEGNYTPTAQLFVWLVAAFAGAGPAIAGKIGMTVIALFFCGGFAVTAQAIGANRSAGALFGLIASHSFVTAMGFANFNFAAALAMVAIAIAIRVWEERSIKGYVALSIWMLLVAHGHVMVAGMFGFHIFILSIFWAKWDLRRVLSTGVALAPAALFSVIVAWTARQGYAELNVSGGLGTQRNTLPQQVLDIGWESYGGFSRLGWLMVVATIVGVVFQLRQRRHLVRPLVGVSAVWLVLYFVIPEHGLGWAYAQPRVLIPFIIAAGAFAGWGPRPNLALGAYTAAFLIYLASYGHHSIVAGAEVAAQVERYGDVAPGRTLEAVLDPGRTEGHPGVQPLLHVAQYQYILGGTSPLLPPYSPMIHSVRPLNLEGEQPEHLPMFIHRAFDCSFTPDCEQARLDVGRRLGLQGQRFDSVTLVGGDQSWRDELLRYGYVELAPDMYQPRRAGLDITFAEPPHPDSTFMIRVGWPDDYGWTIGGGRPPGPGSSEMQNTVLGPLPSGPIWVETALRHEDGREESLVRGQVTIVPGEILQYELVTP
ncbi:MAG: hypothetical protein ACJAYU_000786 [Bradymonadia bacterium]